MKSFVTNRQREGCQPHFHDYPTKIMYVNTQQFAGVFSSKRGWTDPKMALSKDARFEPIHQNSVWNRSQLTNIRPWLAKLSMHSMWLFI
jgi:hypothetical protein